MADKTFGLDEPDLDDPEMREAFLMCLELGIAAQLPMRKAMTDAVRVLASEVLQLREEAKAARFAVRTYGAALDVMLALPVTRESQPGDDADDEEFFAAMAGYGERFRAAALGSAS